jgi:hypothetical protein
VIANKQTAGAKRIPLARLLDSFGSFAAAWQTHSDKAAWSAHRLPGRYSVGSSVAARQPRRGRKTAVGGAGNSNRERAIRKPRKPLKTNARDKV